MLLGAHYLRRARLAIAEAREEMARAGSVTADEESRLGALRIMRFKGWLLIVKVSFGSLANTVLVLQSF